MADVLPSCIGMEGLLYLIFSGFVQANKSHTLRSFQLVRINPSGGDPKDWEARKEKAKQFPISPH